MNSKQKGNIIEMSCMLYFMKLGLTVLTPYGDCNRYDFVLHLDDKFLRIQCKYPILSADKTSILLNGRSSNKQNGKICNHSYTDKEIDYFATFYNDNCYVIPVNDINTWKKLRLTKPKNNQMKNVCYLEQYEATKMLKIDR